MSKVNPGRLAALRVLVSVVEGGHAEDLLVREAPKTGPDRGLAWHLVLGSLRWQGALDAAIQPHLNRPLRKLDTGVLCALRMGVFEANHSKTPDRAVVHQTVEAVRRLGLGRATGIVNAVLRKAIAVPLSDRGEDQLPPWLYARWGNHEAWLKSLRLPAPMTIAGNAPPNLGLAPAMLQGETVPRLWVLPPGAGSVTGLEGFHEGEFWVMDAAAAKVADIVSELVGAGGTVLDACAAPGGKTFRMTSAGCEVMAVDASESRFVRFDANADRLQLKIKTKVHDWRFGPLAKLPLFDAVLVDAPCTGLGTARRHPEIIWRREPGDPAAMAVTQLEILKNAAQHVKPGGHLVYAVCSTEPEEGEQVARGLDGWTVQSAWASVPPTGDEDGFQAFVLTADQI
jgi:16S rRNA (cytosine967-C5)-methyltransferase